MRSLSTAQIDALADASSVVVTTWTTHARGRGRAATDRSRRAGQRRRNVFEPNASVERTAIKLSAALAADSLDVRGLLSSARIDEAALQQGRFDYATLSVAVAVADRALPSIPIAFGRFGTVSLDDGAFTVEINGPTQPLETNLGEVTTPNCRANFADARCKAPLATWRHTYLLASVSADGRALTLAGPSRLSGAAT